MTAAPPARPRTKIAGAGALGHLARPDDSRVRPCM